MESAIILDKPDFLALTVKVVMVDAALEQRLRSGLRTGSGTAGKDHTKNRGSAL